MASGELSSLAESFHSNQSNHIALASDLRKAANEDGQLQFQDVEAFLNNPENQALLATSTALKRQKYSTQTQNTSNNASEPTQLGAPKTHHHVPLLYIECQQRGLNPEFEYEGHHNGYSCSVTIGGETFSSDQCWNSKKEAKEGVAEKALPFVRAMDHQKRSANPARASQENWIGKLLEYHNATSPAQGPVYTEYLLPNTTFACTCIIPGHPTPFGGTNIPFPNKKAARTNAAREAMQYIIAQGLANPDGGLKAKKKTKIGSAVKFTENGLSVRKDTTYAQKVNDMSRELGLGSPFYQLHSPKEAPNIYSGAVHFKDSPLFPKPLGDVRNVFGQKNAKEQCARAVWEVLKDLAKKRGVQVAEISEDEDAVMET